MKTWTFRGVLENGHCKMRFRMKGAKREGIAVLDTGYPEVLLSRRFATESGLTLVQDGSCKVAGIGQPLREVPRAHAAFQLLSPADGTLDFGGLVAVEDLPMEEMDLLIGTAILAQGTFTLIGPSRTWEWYVRQENLSPSTSRT